MKLNSLNHLRFYFLFFLIFLLNLSPTFSQSVPPDLLETETHESDSKGEIREVDLIFEASGEPQSVTVEVVDGLVFLDGDILLGTEAEIFGGAAIRNVAAKVWPNSTMPYTIKSGSGYTAEELDMISYGINHVNANSNLCLIPRTTETNYVEFNKDSGGCTSAVGMSGGKQIINVSITCGIGATIHEILHAAGHWHEQSREDRDTHVSIDLSNVPADKQHNFNKYSVSFTGADIGAYDYESIMHYSETAFTTDGSNSITVIKPPGTNSTDIGQRLNMSAGDIAAINQVYTTNPACAEITGLPSNLRINDKGNISVDPTTGMITITGIVIKNTGNSSSTATALYLQRLPDNLVYNQGNIPVLAAGATYNFPTINYDASGWSNNVYTFGLRIDPFQNITDGNRSDNRHFWTFPTLTIPLCAIPTPALGAVTQPTTCVSTDGSIQITGLLANTSYDLYYQKDNVPILATSITTDGSGNYLISGLTAGNYTGIYVDLTGCLSATLASTMLTPPTTGSTAATMSGDATINLGSSTPITVAITGGTSPYTVIYTDGTTNYTEGSYTSGAGNPVTPSNNATYTIVSITDANGCEGAGNTGNAVITVNAPCSPQSSKLCPAETITAQEGNSALDLDETNAFVELLTTTSKVLTTSGNQGASPTITGGNCSFIAFNYRHTFFTFRVSQTGSYNFSGSVAGFYSLFQTDSYVYDASNPCGAFTFITASRDETGNGFNSMNGVALQECTDYTLVAGLSGSGTSSTITMSGAGNVIEAGGIAVGHQYTFVAINQTTNMVAAQSATADFTTLTGGVTYSVYGVSYNNTETPSSWVGLTQSVLTNGTRCLQLSSNMTTLNITPPPCSNPTPSLGTTTNPTTCTSNNGSIQLTGLTASTPYTLSYKKDGGTPITGSITTDASGNYTIPNLDGGVYSEINVTISNCTSSNLGPTTLTEQSSGSTAAVMSGTATICNGTSTNISVAITGGTSPYTLVYSDGSANSTETGYTTGANIAVSPTSTKTYTIVSVTDANGCVGTGNSGSAVITVNNGSTAAVMSGTASICSGTSTNISVAITGGTSPFTLVYNDGSANSTETGYTTGANIAVSPTSTKTYTIVSVTDANGCVGIGNSGSAVITVNNGSTAAVISGTASICNGASTNISVAITGGTSPYTLVYSDGSANSTETGYTTGANIAVSPTSTKTYTIVSVTDANGCVGTGNSGSAVITVNNGSTAAVMSGTASICNGTSTNISVAITGGTSPYTLVYNDGSANSTETGYTTGTNIAVSPTSTKTYTIVSVTDANGCMGTGNSGSAVITVNNGSTAAVMSGTASICNGTSTNISVAITGGTSPYTLVYSDGSANSTETGYTTGTNIAVSPTSTKTYTIVSVTDANGCVGTGNSGSAVITVNNGSTAAVMSGTASICNGTSTNISVAITGGTSPYTLVYSDGSANSTETGYTTGANIAVSPTSTKTYTIVSVTDANGCVGTGNSGSAVITVNDLPTVDDISDQTVTAGDMIAAVNFSGTSGATYNWTNDNTNTGIPANGTGNIGAIGTTNSGVSTIEVTPSLNGCPGPSKTFTITVNTSAASCTNGLYIVDTSIDNETYSCDTVSSNQTIPANHTIVYEGCDVVILRPGFHAVTTSTFTARIISCGPITAPTTPSTARTTTPISNPLLGQSTITIHPNPAKEVLNINYHLGAMSRVQMGLYDLTGKNIVEIVPMQTQAKGAFQEQFFLSTLKSGIYFVILQTEKERISKKLIIVK